MFKRHIMIGLMLVLFSFTSIAATVNVDSISELESVLGTQNNGNEIVLAPGEYDLGGDQLSASGLEGVTIRSQNPQNPAILTGGQNIHLIKPKNVTIKDLIIQDMTLGGLNMDDGGETPWTSNLAHDITLQNIVIRNIGAGGGNFDGIKLSGVNSFTIDNVQVIEWGGGGSGVDMVGCHNGTIKNSFFRSRVHHLTTGIVTKGGSTEILIDSNRFELRKKGVAVKLGGSTSNAFFRFWPNESGYEAKNIKVLNNTIIHSRAAVSFVNVSEGGLVENNLIYLAWAKDDGIGEYAARILDEASGEGNDFPTRNGKFIGNTVVFDNFLYRLVPVNIGENTEPNTFDFSNNKWFNIHAENQGQHDISGLPGTTTSGNSFGVDPQACGSLELPSGEWHQISLPCEPQGENAKIFKLFADDIADSNEDITFPHAANYGTDWVVYRYDGPNGYKKMDITEKLKQGEGYWIIQVKSNKKTLSMPVDSLPSDSLPIADSGEPDCLPLEHGCFNIPMATKDSSVQWNMIGYPYKTSQPLSNVRVLTDDTPCKLPGCNLETAKNNKIVHDTFWTYNGSNYTQLDTNNNDQLDPWMGYWSPTLTQAYDKSPKLRLQRP